MTRYVFDADQFSFHNRGTIADAAASALQLPPGVFPTHVYIRSAVGEHEYRLTQVNHWPLNPTSRAAYYAHAHNHNPIVVYIWSN